MIGPVSMSAHLEVRSVAKMLSDFLLFWVFGILFFPDLISGSFALGEIPLRIITCFHLDQFGV